MNKLILATILSFHASFALANFYLLKEKRCDGKVVSLKKAERVFIDTSRQIIGFGHTEGDCRVVDFKQVTFFQTDMASTHSSIGRRSSCTTEMLPYAGVEFEMVSIFPGSIELQGVTGQCQIVSLKF
jgi:hypothetical protein